MNILDDFVERKLLEPFKWGINDCILFANEAVKIATGIDHALNIGVWDNPESVKKLMLKLKYNSMYDIFDVRFRQHTNLNKLQDGDLATSKSARVDETFKDISLVYYKNKLLAPSKEGLKTFNLDVGDHFFNVRSLRI